MLRDADTIPLAARHGQGDGCKLTRCYQLAYLVITALKQFCNVVNRVVLRHKKPFAEVNKHVSAKV